MYPQGGCCPSVQPLGSLGPLGPGHLGHPLPPRQVQVGPSCPLPAGSLQGCPFIPWPGLPCPPTPPRLTRKGGGLEVTELVTQPGAPGRRGCRWGRDMESERRHHRSVQPKPRKGLSGNGPHGQLWEAEGWHARLRGRAVRLRGLPCCRPGLAHGP